MDTGLIVYDLTPLTRGAASQRRVVIKTFEMRYQRFIVLSAALVPAIAVTAILWPLAGSWALIAFAAVLAAAIWLFDSRSAKSMGQVNIKALQRRWSSNVGQFMVAGVPSDPLGGQLVELVPYTVLAPPPTARSEDDAARVDIEEDIW